MPEEELINIQLDSSQADAALKELTAAINRLNVSVSELSTSFTQFAATAPQAFAGVAAQAAQAREAVASVGQAAVTANAQMQQMATGQAAVVPTGVAPAVEQVGLEHPERQAMLAQYYAENARSAAAAGIAPVPAPATIAASTQATQQATQAENEMTVAELQAAQATETLGNTVQQGTHHMNLFERQLARIAIGIAVWSTLRFIVSVIQETIEALKQYSIEVARFAAITDQSVGDAISQYNALRDAAAQRGFTPTEAAPAIQTVARFTRNPAEQQQIIEAGTKLAELMGQKDPSKTVEAISTALRASGQNAAFAATMVDQLWSSFKRVRGVPEDFLASMTDAVELSQRLGVTWNEAMNLIMAGAAATGRSTTQVTQALFRMSEGLENLQGDKLLAVSDGFYRLGINALDSQHNIRPLTELLADASKVWSTLSTSQRVDLVDLLFGGTKVRGQMAEIAQGFMNALIQGLDKGVTDFAGSADRDAKKIDDRFGQIDKVVRAHIATAEQNGEFYAAALAKISLGIGQFLGSLTGGVEGATKATQMAEFQLKANQIGGIPAIMQTKEEFIQKLTGMKPGEAEQAIKEYNAGLSAAFSFMPIGGQRRAAELATIKQDEANALVTALQEGGAKIMAAGNQYMKILQMFGISTPGLGAGGETYEGRLRVPEAPTAVAPAVRPKTAQELLLEQAQQAAKSATSPYETFKNPLPTDVIDLTKYSQQQINDALREGLLLHDQMIAVERAKLVAMHVEGDQIDAIIARMELEYDMTLKIVKTRQGLQYIQGAPGAFLQQAIQQQEPAESSFAFQRLRNVEPSQFPQLQALAAMYNQMLSAMGSPEKNKNINLLLGDENVFKTINVRMTALQMALEDLTKVEKAQLSGTWNLPAGATALVPIQSLDIQRWNAKGGGGAGMSPEMFAAMLEAMKAASQAAGTGGGGGGGLVVPQRRPSTAAEGLQQAADIRSHVAEEMAKVQAAQSLVQRAMGMAVQPRRDVIDYEDAPTRAARLRGQQVSQALQATVNVSMLPLNAVLNVNIPVLMNGQVIARVIQQLFYQFMTKASRATSTAGGRTTGHLR